MSAAPTRALDRGLRILEAVAARSGQTLAEISAACELSPATALRIIETLRARDYLIRDEATRTYGIGLRALEVGSRFMSDTGLKDTARGTLRTLAARTGQSATLAVLQDRDVVYVDVQEGTSTVRPIAQTGGRAPVHASASGKILLAWRWAAGQAAMLGEGPLPALTPNTILDPDTLREELAHVRAQGLAYDREELNMDIRCIAAPIHNRDGEVVAAIGLQGLTRQFLDQEDEFAALLKGRATEISSRMGWRPRSGSESKSDAASSLLD